MYPKKPRRRFTDNVAWIDLVPAGCELLKPTEGERRRLRVERRVAFQARQGRGTFPSRSPPHQYVRIARCKCLQAPCRSLGDQQRDDRRRIPKSHRLSGRSSRRALTADVPALAHGGCWLNSVRGGAARRGRTIPSRTSRNSLPSRSASRPVVTGSSRATGRPRSTTRTAEPPLTPSINALR